MIKYKKRIAKILRLKKTLESRYKKFRFDKNERIAKFETSFLKKIISKINSENITSYPEVWTLYRSLAKLHKININQFVITAGIDGAIKNCFELFVSEGDKVVILKPTFAMVNVYCEIFGAKKININYDQKLNLDINHLIKSINRNISLIIIANPNSPTGTLISQLNMERIIKKANAQDVPILIDEAYYGFCNKTVFPLLKKYKNLIIGRTFSKAYGLAGLRVGYIIASSKIAKLLFNLKPMYEVNSMAVLASTIILKNSKIHRRYISETKKSLKILITYLKDKNISFIKTHANFIYINLGKKINYFYNKLFKDGILTKKGLDIKGYNNYLRVTLGSPKQIKIIISRLKNLKKS
tara:strand:+ start:181 stop:1242 length:1062 start_codon:yes stop_codon:yes gene_type:complete